MVTKIRTQKALWDRYENHLYNEGVSDNTLEKKKSMFNMITRGISTNLDKCKRQDIENFINNLNKNNFKKVDGLNYSGSSKQDLKKFLRQFFKWMNGDNEFYPPEVSWIRSKIRKEELPQEKPIITKNQAVELSNKFLKIEYRALTLILFDSGFRIQEALSAKKKDLTWEEYNTDGDSCFWIKCNESKTEKRKVPIPQFTPNIQEFINSEYYKKLGKDELLFTVDYDAYRMCLKRASKKLLGAEITPHCLRHSSATFYCEALNGDMKRVAERYGWSYNSKQLVTYIRRSRSNHIQGVEKVFSNELVKIQKENAQLRKDYESMEAEMKDFKDEILLLFEKKVKVLAKKKV